MEISHSYGLACFYNGYLIFGERPYTYACVEWIQNVIANKSFTILCRELDKMTEHEKQMCVKAPPDTVYDMTKLNYINYDNRLQILREYRKIMTRNLKIQLLRYLKEAPFHYKTEQCKYDLPKGRKHSKKIESDINCAHREFREETGIRNISILKEISPYTFTFIDSGRTYIYTYYFAECTGDIYDQIRRIRLNREFVNIHLMSKHDIRMMRNDHRDEYLNIIQIYEIFKNLNNV